jgi:predicted MPP superfamily phosphohydrolase
MWCKFSYPLFILHLIFIIGYNNRGMKKGRNIVKNSDLYCELFYGKNSIELLEELKQELGLTLVKNDVIILESYKVFDGLEKSSTQYVIPQRDLTRGMVSRKRDDTVC